MFYNNPSASDRAISLSELFDIAKSDITQREKRIASLAYIRYPVSIMVPHTSDRRNISVKRPV